MRPRGSTLNMDVDRNATVRSTDATLSRRATLRAKEISDEKELDDLEGVANSQLFGEQKEAFRRIFSQIDDEGEFISVGLDRSRSNALPVPMMLVPQDDELRRCSVFQLKQLLLSSIRNTSGRNASASGLYP